MTTIRLVPLRLRRLPALLGLAVALAPASHAAFSLGDIRAQYNGFISQGYLLTTGNNHFGETKGNGSPDFRELAVNTSLTFGPHLRVGAQLFAETLGTYGNDKVMIDWAVVDYNFNQQFGLRAGRIKLPRGLYNEALDLDTTRPFVLLPPSLYDARLRDFQAAINGAMAYGSVDTRLGSFDYKVFGGGTALRKGTGVEDMLTRADIVTVLRVKALYGTSVFWSGPVKGLRAGFTYLKQDQFRFAGLTLSSRTQTYRATSDEFSNDNYIGSVEYVRGNWTLASEFNLQVTSDALAGTQNSCSLFYASVARRLNDRWEVGGYYSGTRKSRGMSFSTSRSATPVNEYVSSVKFTANDHLCFKLEAHYVDGRASVLDVPGSPNPSATRKDRWMLFAAKTTITF